MQAPAECRTVEELRRQAFGDDRHPGDRAPVSRDEHLLVSIANAGTPAGRSDARLLLDWLFGRHPESSRTIAVLHYVDGLTLDEVARQTDLSVSGVRRRLRLLRQTLVDVAGRE